MKTTIKSASQSIVQEYEWRGQYVVALVKANAHPFVIYTQAERAASLALDVLGRE